MMRQQSPAFSLVEVTIAIGIFAFVIVGVMGLLPAGMRMRADSAAETRGVLISEELFAAVRAAPSLTNVLLRKGPGQKSDDTINRDITKDVWVLGYPNQTTVPYFWFKDDPGSSWTNAGGTGAQIVESAANAIDTMAYLSATNIGGGLYRVTVMVRGPASLPLANARPATFTTLVYRP
jgi:type II secretory pathway pseudopilin PulG